VGELLTRAAPTVGQVDTFLAGGVETMSDVPIRFSRPLRKRMMAASKMKAPAQMLGLLAGLKGPDFAPVAPGVAEFSTGEIMGHSADRLASGHIPAMHPMPCTLRHAVLFHTIYSIQSPLFHTISALPCPSAIGSCRHAGAQYREREQQDSDAVTRLMQPRAGVVGQRWALADGCRKTSRERGTGCTQGLGLRAYGLDVFRALARAVI